MPMLSREPMTMEQLKKIAPSAFKNRAWSGASQKYECFNTSKLIQEFGKQGWLPVAASQKATRTEEKIGFQTHQIRLGNPTQNMVRTLGELYPEIVITNSHDGLSTLKLHAGFFRLICLNGLIVPSMEIGGGQFKHYHTARELVEQFVPSLSQTMKKFNLGIYEKIILPKKKQIEFAKVGLSLREVDEDTIKLVDVEEVLRPARVEDEGDSLWNVFNRVQENLIKGNYYVTKLDKNGEEEKRKARPINGIKLGVTLNTGLWSHLEALAS